MWARVWGGLIRKQLTFFLFLFLPNSRLSLRSSEDELKERNIMREPEPEAITRERKRSLRAILVRKVCVCTLGWCFMALPFLPHHPLTSPRPPSVVATLVCSRAQGEEDSQV